MIGNTWTSRVETKAPVHQLRHFRIVEVSLVRCHEHRLPSFPTPPRHLLVANCGDRRQTVTKHVDGRLGENPDSSRNRDESGRRESNSRSQLGNAALPAELGEAKRLLCL
jgi:hypothetical protein